ncbi:MAG: PAS domain S-box protein [Chthonomonadetes bacterium]|nr:PAS domain S-box protein [Chthonomonadetes bacterium]
MKPAEEESNLRYRALFECAQDGIFLFDADAGKFVEVNGAFLRMFGYSPEQITQMTIFDLPRDTEENIRKNIQRVLQHGYWQLGERTYRRADGSLIEVEVYAALLNLSDRRYIMAVARDITERKRNEQERQRMQEQLEQARKMETIGTLAAGVAHDFNNVLSVIMGNAELLLVTHASDRRVTEHVRQILQACERGKKVVDALLTLGRRSVSEMRFHNLNSLISASQQILSHILPATIRLEIHLQPNLPAVKMDVTQIEQMIMNLCSNARDAMPSGGSIILRTCSLMLRTPRVMSGIHLPAGEYVCLEVEDTGAGIPPEHLPRIFEPFFTTKPVGMGTGLGLATVYGIVQAHGGGIEVQSTPGKGTCFRILLPAARGEEPASTEIEQPQGIPHASSRRILFVDDEQNIRETVAQMLRLQGYEVDVAANGEEALQILRERREHYHLLITDLTMPEMDGIRLAQQVHALNPDLPVVLCSGYGAEVIEQASGLPNLAGHVQKPYRRQQLFAVIEQALNR